MEKGTVRHLNPAYVAKALEMINDSPFLRQTFMKVVNLDVDSATVEAEIKDVHKQALGMVHGGFYASLIDTAAYWAAFGSTEQQWGGLVSTNLQVTFLSSTSAGRLIATGRLIKMGKTVGYAEARIEKEDGKLVAHGTSTLLVVPVKGGPGDDLPPKFICPTGP